MNHNSYHVFFTNLANPLKIGIILGLKEKEKNVTEISKELGVEQSKVSHALSALKSCHIVDMKQRGKERVYSLNDETIVPMLRLIDKHANANCTEECCALKKQKNKEQ
jgi:ArsR family transcriptional regulator